MTTRHRDQYDWTPFLEMKRLGHPPQEAVRQALHDGYDRNDIWCMLREVYGFDNAMSKAAWCDVQGSDIVPEYRERLDEVARRVRMESLAPQSESSKQLR